jgi:transcription antitermination factor NusG
VARSLPLEMILNKPLGRKNRGRDSLGSPLTPEDYLNVGDWVEIVQGPLTGMQGRIFRRARKRCFCVEVQMLQAGVSVEVERSMLRPLSLARPAVAVRACG